MNKSRLVGAFSACGFLFVSLSSHAVAVPGQGTWEATLQARDLDGNTSTIEAYYDTVLGITWLANANAAIGSAYDTFSPGSGRMNWANANAWAVSLNIGGVTGWRLPATNPIDGTTADDATISNIGTEDKGYNISAPGTLFAGSHASEMAFMFYNTLGNLGLCDPALSVTTCSVQPGYGLTNTGPISNFANNNTYWSSTVYAPAAGQRWVFNVGGGNQSSSGETFSLWAWAVHSGDVGASIVPVPAAVWLFGSGLLGLIGLARRKAA